MGTGARLGRDQERERFGPGKEDVERGKGGVKFNMFLRYLFLISKEKQVKAMNHLLV